MTVMADTWRQIVSSGVLAPSGDNLQPWILESSGESLHVSIDTSRDRSLYNFRYRASLIALGALIENVTIAAPEFGLATNIEYASSSGPSLPSARLTLHASDTPQNPLFLAIDRRCTNRRAYRTVPLSQGTLDRLRQAVSSEGEIVFIEDARQRRLVARAASLNDRLLFEMRSLHDSFFETIRWTDREAQATRDGLFIRTLELGPLAPGFKTMRSWNLVRVANAFGASLTAPVHSFRTFMRSAAFGFLQMADDSHRAFIEGGRLLQRLWLTATSLGLAFQPMAGMLYLLPYLRAEEGSALKDRQRLLLNRAENLFKGVLPLDDRKAAIMLFRIGYGPPPTARSLRRKLDQYLVRSFAANSREQR